MRGLIDGLNEILNEWGGGGGGGGGDEGRGKKGYYTPWLVYFAV